MLTKVLYIAVSVLAVLSLIVLIIRKLESKFLYKPKRSYASFTLEGYPHEWVSIKTRDQVVLNGLLLMNPQAKDWVLHLADNYGNLSNQIARIKKFYDSGFSILAIDYRGFGKSGGTPSETGLYEDAMSAYKYLVNERNIPADNIIILGRSLGGPIAIELATHVSAKALIAESSFASLRRLQRERMPVIPLWLVLPERYNSLRKIHHLKVPILFLHGDLDTAIHLRQSQALFDAAAESRRKQLKVLKGAGHADTFEHQEYFSTIHSLLSNLE
jgi:uncharacterized protein